VRFLVESVMRRMGAGTRVPFAFNLDKAVLFDPGTGLRL